LIPISAGVRDMSFDCTSGQLFLSSFLNILRTEALPNISYTSIIGHSHANVFNIPVLNLNIPLPAHGPGHCLSSLWADVVPIDSANLHSAAVTPRLPITITTSRTHTQPTSENE